MENDSLKIAKHWGKQEPGKYGEGYYSSSALRPYFIESAFGSGMVEKYQGNSNFAEDILVEKYLVNRQCKNILSLCCGFGSFERKVMSKLDSVEECLGIDLSDSALEVAKAKAKEERFEKIRYEIADLNNYDWQENKYDLVIANGALHHLNNLEQVLEGIKHTLKPGGTFYSCEYVGPNYMDHNIRQLELINACSYLMPQELRARKALPVNINNESIFRIASKLYAIGNRNIIPEQWAGWKKAIAKTARFFFGIDNKKLNFGVIYRSPKKYLLKVDPSECIRSSEIIPICKKYFPDIEICQFGGGILQHALDENFYSSFDRKNPIHVKSLELLWSIEQHLMSTKEIPNENAFLIARKENK